MYRPPHPRTTEAGDIGSLTGSAERLLPSQFVPGRLEQELGRGRTEVDWMPDGVSNSTPFDGEKAYTAEMVVQLINFILVVYFARTEESFVNWMMLRSLNC